MRRAYLFLTSLLFTITLAACGANKVKRAPLFLEPSTPPAKAIGLKSGSDNDIIFETPNVRFSLTPLRRPRSGDPKLIQSLTADGFIIIDMEITNLTGSKKVIFNPSMSALRDSRSGYKKPLEYTALFSVAMKRNMEGTLNRELKGKFFDTNEIVLPERKSRKFLIFTPYTGDSKKAQLTFQEVYIGNETINIKFPFRLTGGD